MNSVIDFTVWMLKGFGVIFALYIISYFITRGIGRALKDAKHEDKNKEE